MNVMWLWNIFRLLIIVRIITFSEKRGRCRKRLLIGFSKIFVCGEKRSHGRAILQISKSNYCPSELVIALFLKIATLSLQPFE